MRERLLAPGQRGLARIFHLGRIALEGAGLTAQRGAQLLDLRLLGQDDFIGRACGEQKGDEQHALEDKRQPAPRKIGVSLPA